MKKIGVLVVDDSAFMRKLITDFLSQHPEIVVVGTARNGEEAVKKLKDTNPDVMTLDVEMPGLTGLEVLKIVMAEQPVPVIMLSSTTKQGAENTLQAIQYGAVDFIAKPSGSISMDLYKIKEELTAKVISASKANIKRIGLTVNKKVSPLKPEVKPVKKELSPAYESWGLNSKKLICIGTSTGGPRALQEVLTKLPGNLPVPVLVVQHMPAGFTKSLASRLDSLSSIDVKEAEDGEILQKGTAYIAPGGFHMLVKPMGTAITVRLETSEPRNGHRPSVDVLFESVSQFGHFSCIAVVMTGMGSDGAKGLEKLKSSGRAKAIAESEQTSVVFGMPKAAIATGKVDEIKEVQQIAEAIMAYI
ncbi:chemotaxis response regulator protein-glutamate methylesterase [Mesobacillus foraminis]|uniref:protein-glutamate methylesterase/protein-glutamine glutaminase n=1 Tax=Mesobacillus foraminis TaxID=279826 RepID=UPI001BEA1F39|nr:chemotaxis response regulator protein-glutamate methylesterase [Mesobacillus foraminis]MBT2755995.1 chemotaxis response regulator protein-glutamate methylesterase [Mesobacillus foraminis]